MYHSVVVLVALLAAVLFDILVYLIFGLVKVGS